MIDWDDDEDSDGDRDDDPFDDPAPLFGCACENTLSVDTCCENCIEIMKEQETMTTPAADPLTDSGAIEAAFIEEMDSQLAIASKLLSAGDTGRAILHTTSAATQLGYLQGRARDMMAPPILAARDRLNIGVLAVAVSAAPPRPRKRSKKETKEASA